MGLGLEHAEGSPACGSRATGWGGGDSSGGGDGRCVLEGAQAWDRGAVVGGRDFVGLSGV